LKPGGGKRYREGKGVSGRRGTPGIIMKKNKRGLKVTGIVQIPVLDSERGKNP